MLQTLSPNEILNIWERCFYLHPVDRALIIILHSYPEMTFEEIAKYSILKRDICLFDIYRKNYGSLLRCFSTCPLCKEKLEFNIASEDILSKQNEIKEDPVSFTVKDNYIKFRLPNSLDLASAALCENALTARNELIKKCIIKYGINPPLHPSQERTFGTRTDYKAITGENEDLYNSKITQEIIDAVAEYMGEYDQNGEIDFDLKCNTCGHERKIPFDILTFLWKEIAFHAKRLLYEIHILASIYGWHEKDILQMSAVRRRYYLEMAS